MALGVSPWAGHVRPALRMGSGEIAVRARLRSWFGNCSLNLRGRVLCWNASIDEMGLITFIDYDDDNRCTRLLMDEEVRAFRQQGYEMPLPIFG